MKFSCDRCQTRYSIGDEKVRGKVLKIRCKTCGNIIVVREATTQAGAIAAAAPAAAAGGGGSTAPAASAQPAAVARANPQPSAGAASSQSMANTRPASSSSASSSSGALGSSNPSFPSQPSQPRGAMPDRGGNISRDRDVEWYVAIKGKQHGPAKKDDVARLFREGRITERTYLWNEHMPQWTRMREVPEFAAILAGGAPAEGKRPPPPPPSDESGANSQGQGAEIIPFDEARRARDLAQSGNVSTTQNDPFAAVSSDPRLGGALDGGAPRDSTRVFIMQAGLHNRSKKNKLYAGVAGAVVVLLVGVCWLDYAGWIEIPGLHSAIQIVASPKEKEPVIAGAEWDDGEQDPKLACQLKPDPAKCEQEMIQARAKRRAGGGKRVASGGVAGLSEAELAESFRTGGGGETAPNVGGTGAAGGPGFAGGGLSADEIRKQLGGIL